MASLRKLTLKITLFLFVPPKASKEAGQALVCKTNQNIDVHRHHLLHCLETTTVSSGIFSFFAFIVNVFVVNPMSLVTQNHEFVDEKTYEAGYREVMLAKQVSSASACSSPHGLTSCCSRRKKQETYKVPNSNMCAGLQDSIQELSTIQIRERPLTNR